MTLTRFARIAMIDINSIEQAAARIEPFILKTPLVGAPILTDTLGCEVFLKCEHLQPTGSFKIRGATNKLLGLSKQELDQGVVAASTGNHGAAVACAAHSLGGRATIFVPETTSPMKYSAMEALGASIRRFGTDGIEAEMEARRHAVRNNKVYVSPYNDLDVIAGQGTIGLELLEQVSDIDTVYLSVGGGGLASGVARYIKA
jgi:threonine dehydratase